MRSSYLHACEPTLMSVSVNKEKGGIKIEIFETRNKKKILRRCT